MKLLANNLRKMAQKNTEKNMESMGSKDKIVSAKNSATERRQHNQKQESNGQAQTL